LPPDLEAAILEGAALLTSTQQPQTSGGIRHMERVRDSDKTQLFLMRTRWPYVNSVWGGTMYYRMARKGGYETWK
jgi:hypothetical protein